MGLIMMISALVLGTSIMTLLGLIVSMRSESSDNRIIECPRCHLIMDREKLHISGYDSENSARHIHCPRCKAYIAM